MLLKRIIIATFALLICALIFHASRGTGEAVVVRRPTVTSEKRRSPDSAPDSTTSAVSVDPIVNDAPLEPFINDPSLATRCLVPSVRSPKDHCPDLQPGDFVRSSSIEDAAAAMPLMAAQLAGGPTTRNMTVRTVRELHPKALSLATVTHHPIFLEFVTKVGRYQRSRVIPQRLFEFVGSHANASFDCGVDVDFRLYHQVRAAACEEHEAHIRRTLREGSASDGPADVAVGGVIPLVDEEYFEFVATLLTAWSAAKHGRPYVFFEFGARYGTWAVRAGAAYRAWRGANNPAGSPLNLRLLAVEGNCGWFRYMEEHFACNRLTEHSHLFLSFVAPRSYNDVQIGKPETYRKARAVSLLDMLPAYGHVDMIDFDIQGFEALTMEEAGVMPLVNDRVGFVHFGTHSTDVERRLLVLFQRHHWIVLYFFAGAHTKRLNKGHHCFTPFGPSLFNDGSLGFANPKFYRSSLVSRGRGREVVDGAKASLKAVAASCYWHPAVLTLLDRS